MLTRAQLFLAIALFGNSEARLGCLPLGLFLLTGDMVRARAVQRQGHVDAQRGPLTAEPFLVTLALGRGRNREKKTVRQG